MRSRAGFEAVCDLERVEAEVLDTSGQTTPQITGGGECLIIFIDLRHSEWLMIPPPAHNGALGSWV